MRASALSDAVAVWAKAFVEEYNTAEVASRNGALVQL
jgi:hypothetical protein